VKKIKYKQATDIVVRQFEDQVDLYSQHETEVSSQVLPFLKKQLPKYSKAAKTVKICEFGGGGGDLLKAIKKMSKRKLVLHNAELVREYKKHQADKSIKFLHKSVLESDIPNNTYDVVIVRNVIHHLVNTSLSKTRENQRHAIAELIRITKPGGYILIDEQVNYSAIACSIFFHLSWLATKLKLSVKSFQITPNTIVGYLTRNELIAFCDQLIPKKEWSANSFIRWVPELHWRLTMLMNNTGSAFIAMKKPARKPKK
jgi:2-polyprenyl-3-methyl-5-hydroxy-6-metoxy-1,4-benzoquinol methylase